MEATENKTVKDDGTSQETQQNLKYDKDEKHNTEKQKYEHIHEQ